MGLNILIVDDSPVMRSMIRRIFNLSDIETGEIHFAGHGREALQILDENWIDLVVADLNMPVMDGFEMIRRMHEDEVLRKIPVIVVSTEGSDTKLDKLRDLGVSGIVHKPFAPSDIARAVSEVIYEPANDN